MLTYNNIVRIDPSLASYTPDELAQGIRQEFYPDSSLEDFNEMFYSEAPVTFEDIQRIDPAIVEGVAPEQVWEVVKQAFPEQVPDPEQEPVARALFVGQAPDRTTGEAVTDTARAFAAGGTGMLSGLAWLAGRADKLQSVVSPLRVAADYLKGSDPNQPSGYDQAAQTLDEYSDRWRESQSDKMRSQRALVDQAQEQRALEGQGLLSRGAGAAGDYLTRPTLLVDELAGSAAYAVPIGTVAKTANVAARSGALRAGQAADKAATAGTIAATKATALTGGLLEGADSAVSAGERVRAMTFADLEANSQDYRDLRDRGLTPEQAREAVAKGAEDIAFSITAPVAVAAGKLTAPFETRVLTGTGTGTEGGLTKQIGLQAAEEFTQEAVNRFGANVGVQRRADETQEAGAGVVEAGATGLAVGGAQGAALRGLEAANLRVQRRRDAQYREAIKIVEKARNREELTEAEVQQARARFPTLPPDLFDDSLEAHRIAAEDRAMNSDLSNAEAQVEQNLSDAQDVPVSLAPATEVAVELSAEQAEQQRLDRIARQRLQQQEQVEALTRLEQAAAAPVEATQTTILPERPAEITNVEVYDLIQRDAEARQRDLSPEEQAFVDEFRQQQVAPNDPFRPGSLYRDAVYRDEGSRQLALSAIAGELSRPRPAPDQTQQPPVTEPVEQPSIQVVEATDRATRQQRQQQQRQQEQEQEQQRQQAQQAEAIEAVNRLTRRRFNTRQEAQLAARAVASSVPLEAYQPPRGKTWRLRERQPEQTTLDFTPPPQTELAAVETAQEPLPDLSKAALPSDKLRTKTFATEAEARLAAKASLLPLEPVQQGTRWQLADTAPTVEALLENQPTTDRVVDWLEKKAAKPEHRELAKKLRKVLPKNLQIVTADRAAPGARDKLKDSDGLFYFKSEKGGGSTQQVVINTDRSNSDRYRQEVMLHELIHAATITRIQQLQRSKRSGTTARRAVDDLERLQRSARKAFEELPDNARYDSAERQALDSATQSVSELLAYGLTDPAVARFLSSDVGTAKRGSWGRFVDNIRRVLNLQKSTPGQRKLVEAFDELLKPAQTASANIETVVTPDVPTAEDRQRAAAQAEQQQQQTVEELSEDQPTEILAQRIAKRLPQQAKPIGPIRNFWRSTRQSRLALLSRDQLAETAPEQIASEVKEFVRIAEQQDADRNQTLSSDGALQNRWRRLADKDGKTNAKFGELTGLTTVYAYDPTRVEGYRPLIDEGRYLSLRRVLENQFHDARTESSRQQVRSELTRLNKQWAEEQARSRAKPNIDKLWGELPTEWRKLYVDLRDHYAKRRKQMYAALKQRIERLESSETARNALMEKLRIAFESNEVKGPYFPLARFGDYFVTVKKGDEVQEFMLFETEKSMLQARKEILESDRELTEDDVQAGKRHAQSVEWKHVDPKFATTVTNLLKEGGSEQSRQERLDIADQVWQLYLQSLPELSVRKQFIQRKKTAGWSRDALRAFSRLSLHSAHHLARLNNADKLASAVERIREKAQSIKNPREQIVAQDYATEFESLYEWTMNPNSHPVAQMLTSFGFLWYLGVSPAAAAVNTLQTPMVTLPHLAARFGTQQTYQDEAGNTKKTKRLGAAAASKEMAKAAAEFAGVAAKNVGRRMDKAKLFLDVDEKMDWSERLKNDVNPKTGEEYADRRGEKSAFEELVRRGDFDKTLAHDIAGIADEGYLQKEGLMNRLGERLQMRELMNRTAALFHNAEVFNREVTGMTAYRLARKAGLPHDRAVEEASSAIKITHFTYSNPNRARALRHPAIKVVGQFKQYAFNMTFRLIRDFYVMLGASKAPPEAKREAKKRFAAMMGMSLVFAGLEGTVFWSSAEMLGNVIGNAFGDDEEPFDFKYSTHRSLAEAVGEEQAAMIMLGPLDVKTGAGVGQRVSTDLVRLWIPEQYTQAEGRELWQHIVAQALGPVVGGTAGMVFDGYNLAVNDKEYWRAVEQVVPKFLRDPMKAIRYHTEGIRNVSVNRDVMIDKEDITAWQKFLQASGFMPTQITRVYDRNSAWYRISGRMKKQRERLLKEAGRQINESGSLSPELIEEIRQFSKTMGRIGAESMIISGEDIGRSITTRARRSSNIIDGVYVEPGMRAYYEDTIRY